MPSASPAARAESRERKRKPFTRLGDSPRASASRMRGNPTSPAPSATASISRVAKDSGLAAAACPPTTMNADGDWARTSRASATLSGTSRV